MSIETKNLTYIYSPETTYEQVAVKDINIKIDDNEFVGLIGHTGSGKSTLVQILNGLLKPTQGTVLIDGEDIFKEGNSRKDIFKKVGLVFQYPEHQLFEMTVFKDVAFGPTNLGLSEDEIVDRVSEALDIVKIPEELYEKSPFELSGGQKRRVAIAGVLAMKPDILILDEPTAGLDPIGKKEILSQLESLKGRKTIILVSHIMEDIARLSDRILALYKGEVALSGTPKDVFQKAEELKNIGLALTKSSELLFSLKKRGFDVDTSCFDPESAVAEIAKAISAKNGENKCSEK